MSPKKPDNLEIYAPFRMSMDMDKKVESFRKDNHLSSKAEALRVLISEALETRKKEKK